jgi:hypothetical protein
MMPASSRPDPCASVKPAPPPKKNTVDYIPSKLSYDTAIPVSIFDDRREFIERCKPYDIIDGLNPLDDIQEDTELRRTEVVATHITPSIADAAVKNEKTALRSCCKRSRSPLKGVSKAPSVKEDSNNDSNAAAAAAGITPTFTRPSRSGWAAEQLREGRPYQLLRSHDMERRVRYVLDDCDYEWCAAQNLPPEVVQRGITYLEWAYVASLLTAATPHVEEGATTVEAVSPSASSPESAFSGGHHTKNYLSSNGGGADAEGGAVNSPTSNTIARLSRTRRQSEREKQAAANMPGVTCALCSKNVHVLSQQAEAYEMCGDGAGVIARRGRGGSVGYTRGGRGSAGRSRGASASPSALPSTSATIRSQHAGQKCGTWVNSAGSFPSHDLQHQGLRCRECGVVAHLRCWFLTEPPRLLEAWTCDGCTNYAQHRKRSAGVCCMCGRMGGVLLPYVSSAAAMRDDTEGGGLNGHETQSPLPSHSHSCFSTTAVAESDMVCHAVCALTVPELTIQHKRTLLRRNGLVDMEERPFVYALRRVGKQKYAMHCVFCEHGGTGRCVQCHHPHCFEAMHASCAAEAHTVDCHTDVPSASPTHFVSGSDGHVAGAGDVSSRSFSPGGFFSSGGTTGSNGVCSTVFWAGCSTYCKKHYGYSVSNSVGSAALGDKAEAEALALDLTGLLSGGDGITSPVVKKRGRGRPPVALVQQREAERELIRKLHAYWLERREQRRLSSAQLVSEINARLRPVVEAALRPEIVKVSADKVRLSHFLSLVPEWQWQLVAVVEGELPLPDEEYDDVQKYRKVAHTRRSGNTRSLYDRMSVAATQLDLMCRVTAAMKQECRLRRTSAELEVESLRTLCGWR